MFMSMFMTYQKDWNSLGIGSTECNILGHNSYMTVCAKLFSNQIAFLQEYFKVSHYMVKEKHKCTRAPSPWRPFFDK